MLSNQITVKLKGFAIFTVLGSIAKSKCVPDNAFEDVVAGGPELAFVVYPEGK